MFNVIAPRNFEPRPYQRIATEFLCNTHRAMLIADMGMGKTSATLSALDSLQLAGSNFFPALVIAPKRVAQMVWTGEQEKWAEFKGLKMRRILGDAPARMSALRTAPKADVYTINYDNIPWLCAQLSGKQWPFKIVIADESTRLKNFRLSRGGGIRAAALSKVAKSTGRWINLTGTPAPNGLTDLWGQYWFLDFGARLGRTYSAFTTRWFWENQYTHEIRMQPGADEQIHAAVADVTLALRAEDWLPLEKPLMTTVEVELPKDAQKTYDRMEKEFFVEMGETGIEAFNSGAKSQKLLQMASGAIYDREGKYHEVHRAKNEALADIVEEVNEPIVVVYHWKFDVPRICADFPGARVLEHERDVADWNAGRIPLLLVHPMSAGHGIDLQHGGRTIVFYTQNWDLELRQQVFERLGPARQYQSGYKRVVRCFDLVARGTVDVDARRRVDSKESVQDALMRARARKA